MNDSPTYKYSTYNYPEEAYHYMYTPFEGNALLNSYTIDREVKQRDSLSLQDWFKLIKENISENTSTNQDYPVKTEIQLFECLTSITHNKIEKAQHQLLPFLKRYEVKKFLFPQYDSNVIHGWGDKNQLKNYLLLHRCCLEIHIQTKNLKFLNTCLKSGDLLSFYSKRNISKSTQILIQDSLFREARIIEGLIESRAINS